MKARTSFSLQIGARSIRVAGFGLSGQAEAKMIKSFLLLFFKKEGLPSCIESHARPTWAVTFLASFFKNEVPSAVGRRPRMTGVKPLDRRRASRIVARQLAALGHPPGLLLDEGVSALIEKSQGSVPRLRALLASTLFLASTEDAQQIGADLVQRAAESLEAAHQRVTAEPDMFDDDPAAAASGPLRRNAALLAGALGIAAAVAVVLTVVSHGRGPPGKAAPAASIQPSRPLMPAHPATPVQTPARASIPPPATVAPLVKSPKPPVPAVVIRYTLGDPAAAARMEAIGARLRGEKFDVA
jgi:hypothetical protein